MRIFGFHGLFVILKSPDDDARNSRKSGRSSAKPDGIRPAPMKVRVLTGRAGKAAYERDKCRFGLNQGIKQASNHGLFTEPDSYPQSMASSYVCDDGPSDRSSRAAVAGGRTDHRKEGDDAGGGGS